MFTPPDSIGDKKEKKAKKAKKRHSNESTPVKRNEGEVGEASKKKKTVVADKGALEIVEKQNTLEKVDAAKSPVQAQTENINDDAGKEAPLGIVRKTDNTKILTKHYHDTDKEFYRQYKLYS